MTYACTSPAESNTLGLGNPVKGQVKFTEDSKIQFIGDGAFGNSYGRNSYFTHDTKSESATVKVLNDTSAFTIDSNRVTVDGLEVVDGTVKAESLSLGSTDGLVAGTDTLVVS